MKMNTGYLQGGEYEYYTVENSMPLLEWLLEHVGQSRTKIKATLQGRGIKVNGKTVIQFDFPLLPGMKVAVSKTKRNQQQFKSRYVKIVYEERWIIVVEKNIGILSMAAGHSSLNVKSVLDDYFKKSRQKCTAHVVHRLDRDTSGLMVYAKDIETEQILEHNWHQIVYDRRYVAVVSGEMMEDEGTIQNWLKDNKAYITYSSPVDNGGKLAITHFHVMDRTTEHTLVEFKLETGRKNQIRVHSADMGHPVCGDVKYGNGDDPLHRLCLHAWLLCFHHPITGEPMEFETPIPTVFRQLFNDYLQLDILCGSIGNYCICCPIYKKGDELYDETCPVFHTTRHLMRFLLSFILQKRICVTSYVRHLCQQIIPLPYLQSACQDLLHRGRDQIHLSCCIESSNMSNLDWVPQSLMEQ